jgi:uncharacterized Zn finger protein
MSLTSQFADDFDSAILYRGADYFSNGRVNIDSASVSRIVAIVRGSSRYRVQLKREGRKIHASCTCPYFDVDLCRTLRAPRCGTGWTLAGRHARTGLGSALR